MKKYIYLLCALFTLGFFSCSNEEELTGNGTGQITVSFDIPGSRNTTPATDVEKALHQVFLYCFEYDFETQAKGKLKKIITVSDPTAKAPINLEKGGYYIEAIANEQVNNLAVGASYSDFETARATTANYDNWNTAGFQMQGAQTVLVKNNTSLHISFTMIRLVARIDVVNNVEGLTVTEATLANSVKESFYLEDANSTIAAETNSKESRTITLSLAKGEGTCAFYTYEGAAATSGLQVTFKGTDANGTVHSSLPIAAFTNANAQPAIMRNKLYVVILNEVDGEIKADISIADWNHVDVNNEVTVEKGLEVTVDGLSEGLSLSDDEPATAGEVITIHVPAEGGTFNLNVESTITPEITVTEGSEWITKGKQRTNSDGTITVAPNTGSERTGTITVKNPLDGSTVTYIIVQEGAEPWTVTVDSIASGVTISQNPIAAGGTATISDVPADGTTFTLTVSEDVKDYTITCTGKASNSDNTITIAANNATSAQTSSVTVTNSADNSTVVLTVSQAAAEPAIKWETSGKDDSYSTYYYRNAKPLEWWVGSYALAKDGKYLFRRGQGGTAFAGETTTNADVIAAWEAANPNFSGWTTDPCTSVGGVMATATDFVSITVSPSASSTSPVYRQIGGNYYKLWIQTRDSQGRSFTYNFIRCNEDGTTAEGASRQSFTLESKGDLRPYYSGSTFKDKITYNENFHYWCGNGDSKSNRFVMGSYGGGIGVQTLESGTGNKNCNYAMAVLCLVNPDK